MQFFKKVPKLKFWVKFGNFCRKGFSQKNCAQSGTNPHEKTNGLLPRKLLERQEDKRTEEQTEGPKFIEHFQPWA